MAGRIDDRELTKLTHPNETPALQTKLLLMVTTSKILSPKRS